ncbi:MAG: sigma-70 family RNA polymerase sigma factor [Acidobacteria bacterium]|nr:MAG: sigma-70 family RNA polymerase sigma factor [Acidobacteriota bacterium]
MDESDAITISLARDGDDEAFRTLVERHSRDVFRLAYRITVDQQDAEDVVQETFLRAYRGLKRFQGHSGFGTWLYRIAVNCSLDRVRRRRPDSAYDEKHVELDSAPDSATQVSCTGESPEAALLASEVRRQVASALRELSPLERTAFILRHFEGLSIEQIGAILGTECNATKHSIFRGIRKMRRVLAPVLGRTP